METHSSELKDKLNPLIKRIDDIYEMVKNLNMNI